MDSEVSLQGDVRRVIPPGACDLRSVRRDPKSTFLLTAVAKYGNIPYGKQRHTADLLGQGGPEGLQGLPERRARRDVGALTAAAEGRKHDLAKPMKGFGSGMFEVALKYDTDAYRTVYALQLGDDVWVLQAFQKKAKQRIKTPKKELALIRERLKRLKKELILPSLSAVAALDRPRLDRSASTVSREVGRNGRRERNQASRADKQV